MSEYQATHTGKNSVLSFFETEAETPYFSLWVKSQKQTQYTGADMDKAVEKLEHWLNIYEKENFDKIVILKLHIDKEKDYTTKSAVLSQIYFKIGETKPVIQGNDLNAYYINEINNLRAEINALKLKENIEEEEEEEEEEENATQKTINGVLGALEHPVIAGLLNRMFTGGQPVRNLAGVNEGTADQYVQMLFNKGVTLDHLRKLAEMPEAKIKMLLTML
jgi:hypothetical protein